MKRIFITLVLLISIFLLPSLSQAQVKQLRDKGIASEIYHEKAKFDKQFKYAEKKNIPFAVIIGSEELNTKTAVIKNLKTGVQVSVGFDDLAKELKAIS